jgi:hypothetical protein
MIWPIAVSLISGLFGSALTIQIMLLPALVSRIADRSSVARVSMQVLRTHHTVAILVLAVASTQFLLLHDWPTGILSLLLLLMNLYQRFWIFTKMHLVKQPIGVQDLIQPDNVLREEFNRLHNILYWIFRIHLLLLFVDVLLALSGGLFSRLF